MDLENRIITSEAAEFLAYLQKNFGPKIQELLENRKKRKNRLDKGYLPDFLCNAESIKIREKPWKVAQPPQDLKIRYGEITGPASDRKGMIYRANSGADTAMEDSEDSESPTWNNILNGQLNLYDRVRGDISFEHPTKGKIGMEEKTATLMYRPRGLHLTEKHLNNMSASLFDAGLFLYHNAEELVSRGSGPYFYLPKLENHKEAALWNNVFKESEKYLGIKPKSIKATILVENLLMSFEMEETLYKLRNYIVGFNAGRWDYIASCIAKSGKNQLFPDRDLITMNVPFMEAYTELLVGTCLKREAQPIGGMSALIPGGGDADKSALEKISLDKKAEAVKGFIGGWIAHPAVVETVRRPFIEAENNRSIVRKYVPLADEELPTYRERLLDFQNIPNWTISNKGAEKNVNVSIEYISNWLAGRGAVGINGLMEDFATVEISLRQLNQWVAKDQIKLATIDELIGERKNNEAAKLVRELIINGYDSYATIPAYSLLE